MSAFATKTIALSSFVLSLSVITTFVAVVAKVAVSAFPIKFPVKFVAVTLATDNVPPVPVVGLNVKPWEVPPTLNLLPASMTLWFFIDVPEY